MRKGLRAIATISILCLSLWACTPSSALNGDAIELSAAGIEQLDVPILWVDVRNPWEYDRDHIEGSYLIPLAELSSEDGVEQIITLLAEQAETLDNPPTIVLYCERGIRSAIAQQYLTDFGIESVSLAGGIRAWRAEYGE